MNIVIVGGGFAGMNLAKQLSKDNSLNITLIDKNNYHFFPPLIYQVATAFIETSIITYPFRKMFRKARNFRFHYGALERIDTENKVVFTTSGKVSYDYAVLAMGTETNYFGMDNVEKHAVPMKTIDDAIHLRNHILRNGEWAAQEANEVERVKFSTIVIAGGGPTGVELAGMLAYMNKKILAKEYPEFSPNGKMRIVLVDMLPTLLGPMSKKSQQEALEVLQGMGVEVKLNTGVKDYVDGHVIFADGTSIATDTLIWSSGVIAKEAPGLPQDSIGKGRRILVDAYNRVQGLDDVFAIGDICLQTADKDFPNGHPQLAQVAIQQGILLAENIVNMIEKRPLKPFKYNDKGSMAIITKNKAVVDLPKFTFTGWFAWLTWLFIHIIPIAGFRNKIKLVTGWFWSFLTNNPSLRLIIRPIEKLRDCSEDEEAEVHDSQR
ncbi:NAD(P)/FAD-dependent oxidoreductase [Olivibacter sp. SDN3]|uniref:NAD(P)/FAD-dependent oxidoreductase n=1 Tax=Olivibacter sp. SDN3 TaxID=2764720 RepID=UPI001651ABEE|nr:NAD(P)/FAD-dependent oxidoreductase [Olivibacter sp. SDN3]QNL51490.1 NAD(P)/FAD-dependent oxidoreductase [Olivibacter sp. SDN3]